MEDKKKKNKGFIIVIVILTILVIALGSYIIYDKVISNKTDTTEENLNNNDEDENKLENITEDDIKNFSNQIDDYNTYLTDYYPINDINNLNSDIILEFASKMVEKKDYNTSFTKKEMDNIINKYFGSDYSYTLKDINCFLGDGILYKYDTATETYNFYGEHPHGGEGFYRSKYYFLDGTYDKETNEYIINTKVLYASYAGDTYGPIDYYFSNGSDAKNNENSIYTVDEKDSENDTYNQAYNEIKDKLPITTYTFVKDNNDNYALKSVIINQDKED